MFIDTQCFFLSRGASFLPILAAYAACQSQELGDEKQAQELRSKARDVTMRLSPRPTSFQIFPPVCRGLTME